MTVWKRLTLAAAALASSKTASAAGASGVVVAAAAGMGLDWLPWAVGAMGCTVVYAYKPPSTRPKALANGVISVFLGGVGGPASVDFAAAVFERPYLATLQTALLASGVLAAAWPWFAPVLFDGLKGMWTGFVNGVASRQQSKGNE